MITHKQTVAVLIFIVVMFGLAMFGIVFHEPAQEPEPTQAPSLLTCREAPAKIQNMILHQCASDQDQQQVCCRYDGIDHEDDPCNLYLCRNGCGEFRIVHVECYVPASPSEESL